MVVIFGGNDLKRKFATEKDLESAFCSYLGMCNERVRFPNIAGFCVYSDMTRDTFYQQRRLYPDAYNKIDASLEDATLNTPGSVAIAIFYLKNRHGYQESPTEQAGGNTFNIVSFDGDSKTMESLLGKLGYAPTCPQVEGDE
jgi:hypothetical protein